MSEAFKIKKQEWWQKRSHELFNSKTVKNDEKEGMTKETQSVVVAYVTFKSMMA